MKTYKNKQICSIVLNWFFQSFLLTFPASRTQCLSQSENPSLLYGTASREGSSQQHSEGSLHPDVLTAQGFLHEESWRQKSCTLLCCFRFSFFSISSQVPMARVVGWAYLLSPLLAKSGRSLGADPKEQKEKEGAREGPWELPDV